MARSSRCRTSSAPPARASPSPPTSKALPLACASGNSKHARAAATGGGRSLHARLALAIATGVLVFPRDALLHCLTSSMRSLEGSGPMGTRAMASAFIASVGALAGLAVAGALATLTLPSPGDAILAVIFAVLVLLAIARPVHFAFRANIDLTTLLIIAIALTFDPSLAVL